MKHLSLWTLVLSIAVTATAFAQTSDVREPEILQKFSDGVDRLSADPNATPVPLGGTPPVTNQDAIHDGAAPLGITYDATNDLLLVVDLFDGLTFRYDPANLAAGSIDSIPNPAGAVTTTGVTYALDCVTDTPKLFWVVPNTLFVTDLDGSNVEVRGALNNPGAGLVGGIDASDADGAIWVNDIVADQYSQHQMLNGNYSGAAPIPHPVGGGFGNGLAVVGGNANNGFEIPAGTGVDGQVTDLIHACEDGLPLSTVDVAAIDTFINGNEHTPAGVGAGAGASSFLVANATNRIVEIDSIAAGICLGGADPVSCVIEIEIHDKLVCKIAGAATNTNCADIQRVEGSDPVVVVIDPDRLYGSAPGTPISDTLPPTTDVISVGDPGTIDDVDVGGGISHTWIGDLTVTVTGPNGTAVTLHNGSGGSADDIVTTYDDDGGGTPPEGPGALSDFDGRDKLGDWTMTISDSAGGDDGTLNSWGLNIDNISTSGAPISTTLPPVLDTVEFLNAGVISDLDVGIQLNHTWIGDLEMTLTSPALTTSFFYDNFGGNNDNINLVFDDEGPPMDPSDSESGANVAPPSEPLSVFDGEDKLGVWSLTVADTVGGDDGELLHWDVRPTAPGPPISTTLPPAVATIDVASKTILDLDVGVQLNHTWIGDLEMTLTSPSLTTSFFYDNFGGNNDNIDVTFDDEGAPFDPADSESGANVAPPGPDSLSVFDGEDAGGTWTFSVADTVGGDDGNLNGVCLHTTTGGLPIGFGNPDPVTDVLNVPNYGIVEDANVMLDIFHTFAGDLIIDLAAPDGTIVNLHAASGGSADFTQRIYNDAGDLQTDPIYFGMGVPDVPPDGPLLLSDLDKGEKFGDWTVTILDTFPNSDDGIFSQWCLLTDDGDTVERCFDAPRIDECNQPGLVFDDDMPPDPPVLTDIITSAAGQAAISDLDVFLDVSTAFVGDLQINLTSPALTAATLLDGQGGANDNLLVTFDDEGIAFDPAELANGPNMQPSPGPMSTWDGEGSDGDWTMTIEDTFPTSSDSTWNEWCLSFEVQPFISTTLPPLVTTVEFDPDFLAVNDANVLMDITHTFSGDLEIDIEHDATIVRLNDGTGGSNDNIVLTYDDAGVPNAPPYDLGTETHMQPTGPGALADFNAAILDGTWSLTIVDTFGGDDGILNSWCVDAAVRVPDCMPPVADFTQDVTVGNAPLTVNFTDLSTGTAPFTYLWDFGDDGDGSTDQNPSNTYTDPGLYTVSLTVTNACGEDTLVITDKILVRETPTASFTAAPTFGPEPLPVDFTDTSTGDVDTYLWDFGDGGTGGGDPAAQNPTNTYSAGTYTVSLTVTGNGDDSTDTQVDLVTALAIGDCDGDGTFGLADAVFYANYLFAGGPTPPCPVTCNSNGDAAGNLGDVVYSLNALFLMGPAPVPVAAGTPCAFP